FGFRMPGAALAELLLLWVFIVATIRTFFVYDLVAAWMMVPYLAWVSFAGALNAAIWILNR
ncbi:MAG TPA: tryptophan-rich sensory protein, partial [Synergistales bacterium]|nr:tryptophan-rich sensory protein [Synergistales bacterium]